MNKRLFKTFTYQRFLTNYPKLRLGSFFVAILAVFLIIIGTFTQINILKLLNLLFHPLSSFTNFNFLKTVGSPYYYIPQIPIILFISALLGPRIGILSVLMYIIAGLLGLPVFAYGGGIKYFNQQGFGYILGYLIAVIFVGKILSSKVTSLSIFRACIVGVLSVHIIGIIYLTILLLMKGSSLFFILGWIGTFTGMQLPYDLAVSFISISLARPVRGILWLIMS